MAQSLLSLATLLLFTYVTSSEAHLVITYPGWRGDNLITNGTAPQLNPASIGIDYVNGTPTFPYGMQWMYPCGGMPQTTNRTLWPVTGGAIGFQPGWFPGHAFANIFINIGINGPGDLAPPNMSHPIVPIFGIAGPSNVQYDGQICLPRVSMPAGINFQIGDNITIQVIEQAQHGASLYSCVDVTLADPKDVAEVNSTNCRNDTWIGFQSVFTTQSLTSSAVPGISTSFSLLSTAIVVSTLVTLFWI